MCLKTLTGVLFSNWKIYTFGTASLILQYKIDNLKEFEKFTKIWRLVIHIWKIDYEWRTAYTCIHFCLMKNHQALCTWAQIIFREDFWFLLPALLLLLTVAL